MIDQKLNNLFYFLRENREYNKELQEKYYTNIIGASTETKEKIIKLLYAIANTQSQPKMDSLAVFFKKLHQQADCLLSFTKFSEVINSHQPYGLGSLFYGMKNQEGWGEKTAALFAKSIFHLHNGEYPAKFKIWDDAPSAIAENDDFFLPVDAVIIAIFHKLDRTKNWNFKNINNFLKKQYKNSEMEIWDDLWFWGFITQRGSGINRLYEWNENKYWALPETNKDLRRIDNINNKALKFLECL
ncbi:MAG: hypothetical protein KDK41_18135 [Leptospiraceae bacterium]|nr:hypothetical protein [Leptospiraceae bacterium]